MPGDKPICNPEGLSEEELKADEEAAANKQGELIAKARAKQSAEQQPSLRALVKPKRFRKGLGIHHGGRVEPAGKPDKSDIEDNSENIIKKLNRPIRDLLTSYNLQNAFKITGSNKNKGSYIFKLLENYKTLKEFEDKAENILPHLEEYLKNEYGD